MANNFENLLGGFIVDTAIGGFNQEITNQMSTRGQDPRIKPALGKQDWIGKLVLEYYSSNSQPVRRVIPFYENCKIQETQAPRLTSYSPIGRASNSFAYTGSNSRQFKIKSNITLPHLYTSDEQMIANTRGQTNEQKRNGILDSRGTGSISRGGSSSKGGGPAMKYDVHYQNNLDEMDKKMYKWASNFSPMYQIDSDGSTRRRKIIDRIASMVASIRSSVVNNATNPVYGVPIVRLSYGILYDNVPCVCDGYSIDYDPVGGFDVKTMLPRILTIGMTLKETRTFQDSASRIEDKLTGWEVIISDEYGGTTMDPGGGF